jgi:hypothetical protein
VRLPLVLSQTTVPFVAPFDDDGVLADAESVGWALLVVAEDQIRPGKEGEWD